MSTEKVSAMESESEIEIFAHAIAPTSANRPKATF